MQHFPDNEVNFSNSGADKPGASIRAERPFSRDVIKYFAMFTMTLNHLHYAKIIPDGSFGTFCRDIGYFTLIAMTYFLVEGYDYTRNRAAYGSRILLFAMISELPYCLALSSPGTIIDFFEFNILFNLYLCFRIISTLEEMAAYGRRTELLFRILFYLLLSLFCDWSCLAPIFTILFYRARHGSYSERTAWLLSLGTLALANLLIGLSKGRITDAVSILAVLDPESLLGPFLAFLSIGYGYNGRRLKAGQNFSKWFFYIYYPAHLSVIALIRIVFLR